MCISVSACLCICLSREREIYFKVLAHMIMKAGKSKISWVIKEFGDPRNSQCAVQVQRQCTGKILSFCEEVSLCSIIIFN